MKGEIIMGKENVIKLLVSASLLGFESYEVANIHSAYTHTKVPKTEKAPWKGDMRSGMPIRRKKGKQW